MIYPEKYIAAYFMVTCIHLAIYIYGIIYNIFERDVGFIVIIVTAINGLLLIRDQEKYYKLLQFANTINRGEP